MKISLVSAIDSAADSELRSLDAAMGRFYNGTVVADYYRAAHAANVTWAPDSFHQIVKRQLQTGHGYRRPRMRLGTCLCESSRNAAHVTPALIGARNESH